MSEIIIDQTDLNITVTPNTTQLNVFTGGYACAQGNTTEFQYNNGGVLAGANGLTYNSGSQTTTAANLTVTNNTDLGSISNITISGGNAGEVLTTDGSGGLSFTELANANFAAYTGNVVTPAQPNITSVGNLTNLTVTGNVTASYFLGNGSQLTGLAPGDSISNGTSNVRIVGTNGNVAISVNGNSNVLVANSTGITVSRANLGAVGNLRITGGNNGFVLQTDGTGNLTWTAMTGNAGNGTVGGSNTQVQYNDGGAFGGSAGFTFNKASNLLSVPGGMTAVGNVTGNFILGDGGLLSNVAGGTFLSNGNSNIAVAANSNVTISAIGNANIVTVTGTGVNVAGTLNVTGNANVGNIGAANGVFTNVSGNGSALSSLTGANVTGTVANATYATSAGSATIAGTVTTAAQPNITSVGTLSSLSVTGNISAGNVSATTFTGALNGAATSATTAGTVTTAAQPNITSVGTLSSLTVTGNVTGGNLNTAGKVVASTLTSNVATGTAPLTITSTTRVANLNVEYANVADFINVTTQSSGNAYLMFANALTGNVTETANATFVANTSNGALYATTFIGNFSGNLSGNATYANTSGTASTVTTSAQSNITSVGTLTSLNVTGNVVCANITSNNNILTKLIADKDGTTTNIRLNGGDIRFFSANANSYFQSFQAGAAFFKGKLQMLAYDSQLGYVSTPYAFLEPTTVANLVAANILLSAGLKAFVTDANTTTFNAIVGGGGSNNVPVFSDGTNWRVG